MAVAPITGMLRRRLILDLSIGLGAGLVMANAFWYGYHVPRRNLRDDYYSKLEEKRAADKHFVLTMDYQVNVYLLQAESTTLPLSSLRRRPVTSCWIRVGSSEAGKLGHGGDMDSALGARILNEVGGGSLEEVLDGLRTCNQKTNYIKNTGITELDEIVSRHFHTTKIGGLTITGRYLPLIYKIASTLASHKALVIIDYEGRFEASRLTCAQSDLEHIYVLRPEARDRDLMANVDRYMLYSKAAKDSAHREFWGTIVIGGPGGDVTAGWKGWLRVDREQVPRFPSDMTIQEALLQRDARQAAVDAAGWQVSSPWGDFIFHE
ncbi:hypothetical protein NQ176_g1180 [Zarea fungicola]|uniref:Uncharacterized protein n=1 Tax=Zarea fungicola TaxID=93591 RepID=A0ACC1NUY6_9HYPO|nr:hypothetical protein NQ176_g1180 [Lecanicillium fungicola]